MKSARVFDANRVLRDLFESMPCANCKLPKHNHTGDDMKCPFESTAFVPNSTASRIGAWDKASLRSAKKHLRQGYKNK